MKNLMLAAFFLASPATAFAQQASSQPSTQAQLFAANHQLQMCLSDDGVVTSRAYDIETQLQAAQKQIETLQAQLAARSSKVK